MQYATHPSRTYPQRIPPPFPRTRLFEWLDDARARHSLIWVSAPAGYGKTTLLRSYARYRTLACAWYDFEVCATDAAKRGESVVQAHPAFGRSREAAITRIARRRSTTDDRVAHEALLALLHHIDAPVVVFDRCDEIPESGVLMDFLRTQLHRLPRDKTLICISRRRPPATLGELRSAAQIAVLDRDSLALTAAETEEIVPFLQPGTTADEAAQLHRLAEGWIAALVAMMQAPEAPGLPPAQVATAGELAIFDYIDAAVLRSIALPLREFLAAAALLPEMTAETTAAVTGEANSEAMLASLLRANLFIERLPGDEPVFRFSAWFRRCLRARAPDYFSSRRWAGIWRRAAAALERAGRLEHAAECYIDQRDWRGLMQFIARHAERFLNTSDGETLARWLATIPAQRRNRMPWAYYWMGVSARHARREGALPLLEKAYSGFERNGDAMGMVRAWTAATTVLIEQDEFARLDPWLHRRDAVIQEGTVYPSPACEVRTVAALLHGMFYRQPQHGQLPQWAARLSELLPQGTLSDQLRCALVLLEYYCWFGDAASARLLVDRLRSVAGTPEQPAVIRLQWLLLSAHWSCWIRNGAECVDAARRGLELADASGIHRWDGEFQLLLMWARLQMQRPEANPARVREPDFAHAAAWGVSKGHYHMLLARHAVCRGDHSYARTQAEAALKLYKHAGTVLYQVMAQAVLSHAVFECGDRSQGARMLSHVRRTAHLTRCPQLEDAGALLQAHFAAQRGSARALGVMLSRAFAARRRRNELELPWWQPTFLAGLCVRALEFGIETDYVQKLVRQGSLIPDRPPVDVPNWPWAVKIYTLGRFALLTHGTPIQFERKAQHKPLQMLKILVALGGREVSEDLLTSVLWPDAEGDAAHSAFDTTLHRLRKLVGEERALVLQDRRVSLDNRYCWVDVWALERLLGQVDATLLTESSTDASQAITRMSAGVLALYQGHFLGRETFEPWVVSPRERMRSKFLRHITEVARFREQRGQWEVAVQYYQKGLEIDDLAELFYQRLMICLAHLGRRSEALAVYRRCRSTLSLVLGIAPSPATEAIRRNLLVS